VKNRKGLSSVVGTVFSIIALVTVVTYVTYSMNTLQQFNQEVMVRNAELIDQGKEEFSVVKTTIAGNKFNITIQNTGDLPINLTRLWIENKSTTNWVDKYDINKQVSPGAVVTNIGQSIPLTALSTKGYEVKLVTERGTFEEFSINSPNQRLYLQLHTVPESVSTEFTTTVLLQVTNNMSNNNILLDVRPNTLSISYPVCATTCSANYVSGPDPTSYPTLRYGDTATFKWIYELQGTPDDQVTFTASLVNGLGTVSATTTIREVISALESGTSIEISKLPPSGATTMLFIHNHKTANWPATPSYLDDTWQLSNASPEGTGQTLNIDENAARNQYGYFTNNATYSIGVNPGYWNASLRYYNENLPPTVTYTGSYQGHILHFNRALGSTEVSGAPNNPIEAEWDSSLTDCSDEVTGGSNMPSASEAPTWSATNGVNGSGGVYFDGVDDYYTFDWDIDCADPDEQGTDNAFVAWIKPDVQPTLNARQYIFWVSNSTETDYWSVYVEGTNGGANHGRLTFAFKSGLSDTVGTCQYTPSGGSGFLNGKWHHIVATKDSTNGELYVNGTSRATCTSGNSEILNDIDCGTNCQVYFGSDNSDALNFRGYMDDVMWINDYEWRADSTSVNNLIKPGFGNAASVYRFTILKTDKNGQNPVEIINETENLPFRDQEDLAPTAFWWGANWTSTYISTVNVQRQERLLWTIKYVSGVGMQLRMDDLLLDGVGDPWSTYLQHPNANATFSSFTQHDNDNNIEVWVNNAGPYGSWLVYQGTRIIFENSTDSQSYAAIICAANSTQSPLCALQNNGEAGEANAVTEHRDSIFIPVNYAVRVAFWEIFTRPSATTSFEDTSGTRIPPGYYNATMFIDGYDEKGQKFLRSSSLGIVYIIE